MTNEQVTIGNGSKESNQIASRCNAEAQSKLTDLVAPLRLSFLEALKRSEISG